MFFMPCFRDSSPYGPLIWNLWIIQAAELESVLSAGRLAIPALCYHPCLDLLYTNSDHRFPSSCSSCHVSEIAVPMAYLYGIRGLYKLPNLSWFRLQAGSNSSTVLSHNVIWLHLVRHQISCGSGQGSDHIASFYGHTGDETHSTAKILCRSDDKHQYVSVKCY